MLVLDSEGVSFLTKRDQDAVAAIRALVRVGAWPPLVPSVVLAESTTGRERSDAAVSRLLETCDVREDLLPASLARRAGKLRHPTELGRRELESGKAFRPVVNIEGIERRDRQRLRTHEARPRAARRAAVRTAFSSRPSLIH